MKITYTVQETIEKEVPNPKFEIGKSFVCSYYGTDINSKKISYVSILFAEFNKIDGKWEYKLSNGKMVSEEDIEYFLTN